MGLDWPKIDMTCKFACREGIFLGGYEPEGAKSIAVKVGDAVDTGAVLVTIA